MMNGGDLKKAAINQAKKVATTAAQAATSNGQKKRRKGDNLKPIITTDGQASAEASSATVSTTPAGWVANHSSCLPPPFTYDSLYRLQLTCRVAAL